jgi:hypothetical protein
VSTGRRGIPKKVDIIMSLLQEGLYVQIIVKDVNCQILPLRISRDFSGKRNAIYIKK